MLKNFCPGSGSQGRRHMESYHPLMLKRKTDAGQETIQESVKKMKPCRPEDIANLREVCATWICESLRPFSIIEDKGFLKVIECCRKIKGQIDFPERRQIKATVKEIGQEMRTDIIDVLKRECDYFTVTSDIWSSVANDSYISLVIHFANRELEIKSLTLKCSNFNVKHTGQEIANFVEVSLAEFGLSKEKMLLFVTDNASNMVSAANILNVTHQGCVAHSLHLIVGNLVRNAIKTEKLNTSSFVDTIASIRKYVIFFKRSPKAAQWIEDYQVKNDLRKITTPVDVVTRWNSTYIMLSSVINMRLECSAFHSFLATREGRSEFVNCKLDAISDEQWWMLEMLTKILCPFYELTVILSGQKYPTWATTLTFLRALVRDQLPVLRETIESESQSEDYCETCILLTNVVDYLVTAIKQRFEPLNDDFLWTTMLDPRVRRMAIFPPDQVERAHNLIRRQMEAIQLSNTQPLVNEKPDSESNATNPDGELKTDDNHVQPNMAESKKTTTEGRFAKYLEKDDTQTLSLSDVSSELDFYFKLPSFCTSGADVLLFWKKHAPALPRLGTLARRWLSAACTSVSSERLFSTIGCMVNKRRARLAPGTVQDIVFVHDNSKLLETSFY